MLDDIMKSPDGILSKDDLVLDYENRQIQELKDLMKKQTAREVYAIIDKNPSNSLWKELANKALEDLDLASAERAFLKLEDYQALQMLKKISLYDDKDKQKAEILVYQQRYDEAEELLRRIERKDLAI